MVLSRQEVLSCPLQPWALTLSTTVVCLTQEQLHKYPCSVRSSVSPLFRSNAALHCTTHSRVQSITHTHTHNKPLPHIQSQVVSHTHVLSDYLSHTHHRSLFLTHKFTHTDTLTHCHNQADSHTHTDTHIYVVQCGSNPM